MHARWGGIAWVDSPTRAVAYMSSKTDFRSDSLSDHA